PEGTLSAHSLTPLARERPLACRDQLPTEPRRLPPEVARRREDSHQTHRLPTRRCCQVPKLRPSSPHFQMRLLTPLRSKCPSRDSASFPPRFHLQSSPLRDPRGRQRHYRWQRGIPSDAIDLQRLLRRPRSALEAALAIFLVTRETALHSAY